MEIIKRNGTPQTFDARKIRNAIRKANATVSAIEALTNEQMDKITDYVTKACEGYERAVGVEEIQDIVEKQLMAMGAYDVAKNYIIYRKKRERARNTIQVREGTRDRQSLTDRALMLVTSMTGGHVSSWDRERITERLVSAVALPRETAEQIAKEVESQILASGLRNVNSALIRELVNNALMDRGFNGKLEDLTMYKVPRDFVEGLLTEKTVENSNIVNNNPESVSFDIASLVLKQYAFDAVFSRDIVQAHQTGALHLHDANMVTRVYCSSHSIAYIAKYGLKGLTNLNTTSHPAKTASVLTAHLNTYLASMQAYYAGALGIGYINIMYAPYLVGYDDKQLHQIAQELIFNGSQNAFSRGSQTIFTDFNLHTGIPSYLKNVPAICPGGKYMFRTADGEMVELEEAHPNGEWWLVYHGKDGNNYAVLREKDGKQEFQYPEQGHVMLYGDYAEEARRFCSALLQVWKEGDAYGHVFEFPKCDFHVSNETFTDPEQKKIFDQACELASHNGSTYFIFDRDEVSLSACCRLRTTITDNHMILHPESMRFCGFQNVTINIPQCAYRARHAGDDSFEGLCKEIDATMDLAVKAHLQKRDKIAKLMQLGGPLYQIGKPSCDGKPYVDLDTVTYIIGMIGVNDAVKYLIGKELHESDEAFDYGLKIISHMYMRCKGYCKEHNLKFTLEESPAESAARRLAKADLMFFREDAEKVFKGGSEDVAYYTNSIHIAAEAPVCLVDRIRKQSMFHSAIESGAIIHAFIGEEKPEPGAIGELVQQVLANTQAAQLTFSPEFTYCLDCGRGQRGLFERCDQCGSTNVVGETRVVGYFSRIQNWGPSKRYGELIARHQGQYRVCTVDDEEAK